MARMLGPRPGRVLLVGEAEGMLARLLAAEGCEVTWVEPCAHAGRGTLDPPPGDSPSARPVGGEIFGEDEERGWLAPGDSPSARLPGDPLRLPFSDGSFDALASQFTLEHLRDPAGALREWVRVLAQGGTLALAVRNGLFRGSDQRPLPRPARTYDPGGLRALVEGSGLAVNEVTTLIPDLKLAALYRGDLSFCLALEKLPYLGRRGRLLFLRAEKRGEGEP